MKTIVQKIDINKEPIHLRVKVNIGSEVVIDQKANSLTYGFLASIANMMNTQNNWQNGSTTVTFPFAFESGSRPNDNFVNTGSFDYRLGIPCYYVEESGTGTVKNQTNAESYRMISMSGDLLTISHPSSGSTTYDPLRFAWFGVINSGSYAGNYKVLSTTSSSVNQTQIQLEGLNVSPTLVGSQITGSFHTVVSRMYQQYNAIDGTGANVQVPLGIDGLFIGTGTEPVKIWHNYPQRILNTDIFSRNGITLSAPNTIGETTKIAISQTFTNVTTINRQVSEFALFGKMDGGSISYRFAANTKLPSGIYQTRGKLRTCIARDVVTPFLVGPAQSFTVTYELVIQNDTKKGMLSNFANLLYRNMQDTTRGVLDTINVSRNAGFSSSQLAINTGVRGLSDFDNSQVGIQIGRHTGSIDIDNFNLTDDEGNLSRITHGTGTGQMYYYGSRPIGHYVQDDFNAYMDIEALFENKSSSPIDVNEVGLNVNPPGNYAVCISRAILEPGERQTVDPGEILKVIYRIAISTGGS